ncbi:hypothetical protein D3C80_1595270 [compost metagenome]
MLDVQFTRGAGERPVAQAIEGFAEPGGGEDFRAAQQALLRRVFQDEKVIFLARALDVFFE